MKKITAIIQGRLGSSRYKNKIIKKIKGIEVIIFLISRLKLCKNINQIIVAIPKNEKNNRLYKLLKKHSINIFRGSEKNILKRYYDCAKKNKIKHILRITADCPLIDIKIIDKMAKIYDKNNYDYFSNIINRSFPDGMDAEFFSFNSLERSYKNVINDYDMEHVTPYMRRSDKFKKNNFTLNQNSSNLRITLDYKEDLELIKKIVYGINKRNLDLSDILKYYNQNPNVFYKNKKAILKHEKNNKKITLGNQIWKEAQNLIAGGNSFFSKRPDVHLPETWPTYFAKAKGCYVFDLNNKRYTDLSGMGWGTNLLGYANSKIDIAVKRRLEKGNMSSLNSLEEVKLAQKLLSMHDWADKVRFTRTGAEANSVAIRLSRASTKRNKIAFCGYHGWHDWYLAANLADKRNLDKHLLPGLETGGVFKELKGSIFPFEYNDFNGLKKLIKQNPDIGIIKMEVIRNVQPRSNFLYKVRKLADQKNIILIFDECTSGFRETFGGICKKYKIIPDLLILGKALGNGYAINVVLGKNKIMSFIDNTFISSTFWSEASGFTAALKTLSVMEKVKSWQYVTNLGKYIQNKWRLLAKKHKLKIKIQGIPALSSFIFQNNHQAYKTFITQEMLKKNILAGNSIYVSTSHHKKILNNYFKILNNLFSIIAKCEKGDDIFKYLHNKVASPIFKRLN